MFKMKGTKRSLLMSALALLLCVSMLIGSTFAWFTDSVTSEGNIIKSGKLDVEMYWADGTKAVPAADSADWTKAASGPIFENNLWEPGYTEARHIAVKNEGTLALKYQLTIVPEDEVSELAEVIDVYYFEDGKQIKERADLSAYKPVGTLDQLINNELSTIKVMPSGKLAAGEDFVATLVLKMQESAGNEYQNLSIGTKFSVQLLATQLTSEKDSYGPDYDKDAWMDEMQVFTPEDLQTAINIGKDPVLQANIELEKPIEIPAPAASTFSLRATPDATVIDLNGHTITGKMHKNDGSVIINNGYLVLKNGTVTSAANNGGSAIRNNGVLTAENVTLNGAPNADGAWPSYTVNNTGEMTANNTKFTSYHGAIASYGEGALVTLNNCEIDMAGIPGFTSHGIYTYNAGAVVVNGGIYANKATDQASSGASVINGNVTVNAGTFSGRIENYYGTPVLQGGTYSEQPNAKFMAEGFKVVANAGSYTVLFPQESFDSLINNAGAGDTVAIPAGTYTFPASKLQAGVTLECAEGTVFEGASGLNVNGATVIGATFSNDGGNAVSGTVNGTFKNCTFSGKNGLRGCYAGETVVFENCVFDGATYGLHFDGGSNDAVFKNCTFSGFNAMGAALTKLTMEGCTFKATGKSAYNGINLWGNTEMIGCTFVFDGTASTEWVDLANSGKTVSFTDCVVTDGKTTKGIETVVGNYGTGNTIIIDGKEMGLVSNEASLSDALANGKDAVLTGDVETESATTAPYGNKYAFKQDGGVLDGNGYELYMECYGDDYGVMTSGGTVKNIIIKEACRAIMIMYPTQDVILDNVQIGGDGVLYPINTGEAGADGVDLIVTNSTLAGWTSYSNIASASFTNVKFEQGTYYNNIYGRVLKPYVNTTMTDCSFVEHMNLDLSGLAEGQKVTMNNCTVNGTAVTLDVFSIPADDAEYDTELFTVDLPSWATSVADCIVIG